MDCGNVNTSHMLRSDSWTLEIKIYSLYSKRKSRGDINPWIFFIYRKCYKIIEEKIKSISKGSCIDRSEIFFQLQILHQKNFLRFKSVISLCHRRSNRGGKANGPKKIASRVEKSAVSCHDQVNFSRVVTVLCRD